MTYRWKHADHWFLLRELWWEQSVDDSKSQMILYHTQNHANVFIEIIQFLYLHIDSNSWIVDSKRKSVLYILLDFCKAMETSCKILSHRQIIDETFFNNKHKTKTSECGLRVLVNLSQSQWSVLGNVSGNGHYILVSWQLHIRNWNICFLDFLIY